MTSFRICNLRESIGHSFRALILPLLLVHGCTAAYPDLVLKSRSPSPDVRRAGADGLARIKEPASLPILLALLEDQDENVMQSSILALTSLDNAGAITPMAARLNHPDAAVRYLLKKGLVKYGSTAVQPLIGFLRHHNPDVQQSAAEVLGRIGDPRAVIPLIGVLKESFPDKVRMAAVIALGEIGDIRSIDALIDALKEKTSSVPYLVPDALAKIGWQATSYLILLLSDPDKEIARLSMNSLGKIGDPRGVPTLIEKLMDTDSLTGETALAALVEIGPLAVPGLIEEAKRSNPEIRKKCIQVMTAIGAPAVVPLIEELKNGEDDFYPAVSETLSKIGSPAVRFLIEILEEGNGVISSRVQETLSAIGESAVDPLMETLEKSDPQRAIPSATVLGNIGDKRAVPVLLKSMGSDDFGLQQASLEALIKIGKPAVTPLIQIAMEDNPQTGELASEALIGIGAPSAEALLPFLGDKDEGKKLKSVMLLTRLGLSAVPFLIAFLADPDLEAAENAVQVLTDIGTPSVLPLIETAGKEDPERSWRAVRILGKMADRRVLPALITAASGKDPIIRYIAVEALGRIHDLKSIPALVDALSDWPVRRRAAEALERLSWHPGNLNEKIRYQIAGSPENLHDLNDDQVKSLLLSDLRNPDEQRASYGVQALLHIWRDDAAEELKGILKSEGTWEMAKIFIGSGSEKLITAAVDWIRGRFQIPPPLDGEIIARDAVI
ncbi:MAG: HEAT repeat domain-containing protein [Thermodesulfobacteriota bacterium]